MAEQNAAGGGSFLLNMPTLLVLLTLASGVLLVSQKLTSTRPAVSVGKSHDVVGEQTVEARLWEDPFKTPERHSKGTGSSVEEEEELPVSHLTTQIKAHRDPCGAGLILPVMLPGGPYSEDQESRIRSRFAIVSALGEQGYVPEDPEHIGSVMLPWPTSQGIKQLQLKEASEPSSLKDLYKMSVKKTATRLDLRYEWYRPKNFYPGRSEELQCTNVLVLWLNERDFETEPLLRLPLLLLALDIPEAVPNPQTAPCDPQTAHCVALIGPYRSSTLRAMLPRPWSWYTQKDPNPPHPLQNEYPSLWQEIRQKLHSIDVYSTTATAMDATLVPNSSDKANPRDSVRTELVETIGFRSFKNFVATDDQLAEEMLHELSLRGVNFTKMQGDSGEPVHHLVLLSEWDTFYARMLWLTYAAKLAIKLHDTASKLHDTAPQTYPLSILETYPVSTLADFIERYRKGETPQPPNLHQFFYLRGLDGQTVGNDTGSARDSDSKDATQAIPTSLDDLRKWPPDANKAEGRAQFDYLSRLGEQLATLEEQLSERGGYIKAIGVVGSDVYDTLLILQALRHRFPNVLFFTTGLDARFWHPRELSWSRNLIVTSGYGLMLHPDLHPNVPMPPFRDSSQTAQFAAVLAALGHPHLTTLSFIPPRRFEIGKRGPVDLSVQSFTGMTESNREMLLHPAPRKIFVPQTYVGIGIVCLTLALLFTFFYRPMRRLTAETLRYREEDVGGIKGASTLVACLQQSAQEQKDPLAQWLAKEFTRPTLGVPRQSLPADAIPQEETRVSESSAHAHTVLPNGTEKAQQSLVKVKAEAGALQENTHEELQRVLSFLNTLLSRKAVPPGETIEQTSLLPPEFKDKRQGWWPTQQGRDSERPESLQQVRQGRKILDTLIRKLVEEPQKSGAYEVQDTLDTAQAARKASRELDALRRRWVCYFTILAVVIGVGAVVLGYHIVQDTFYNAIGEPFSLTTGTSAWPAEMLRYAALALAISFIFQLYHSLRTMIFQLTRHFRLPLVNDKPKNPPVNKRCPTIILPWFSGTFGLPAPTKRGTTASASTLWKDYQRYGSFWRRLGRLLYPLILYIGFSIGLVLWSGSDILRPLRGPEAWAWDAWLLYGAVLSFLFLSFMTIDAARLCRWFIQCLSEAPTHYPLATTDHFSRLRGDVDWCYLDEWIDLQFIADLTERIGRLVYCPFIVFFLLLLARNEWWDRWPWPWTLIAIFVFNLILAAASVVILQNAARKAKNEAEATLEAKVKHLQAAAAESPVQNNANQAEKLLEEIRTLRRGAFVPFWENPVLGAILLPSGGLGVLQILFWLMGP